MKGKTKKIVLAVAVIGAIAAGGVAFTDANTVSTASLVTDTACHRCDRHRRQLHAGRRWQDHHLTVITFDADQTGKHRCRRVRHRRPHAVQSSATTTATCTRTPAQDTVLATDFTVAVTD